MPTLQYCLPWEICKSLFTKQYQPAYIILNHLQGHLYKEDAGYFIVNLDRNSPKVLFDHVPQMYELKELTEKTCQEDLYCGMPMYYPCASMLK